LEGSVFEEMTVIISKVMVEIGVSIHTIWRLAHWCGTAAM
jgi:hypothetical protein